MSSYWKADSRTPSRVEVSGLLQDYSRSVLGQYCSSSATNWPELFRIVERSTSISWKIKLWKTLLFLSGTQNISVPAEWVCKAGFYLTLVSVVLYPRRLVCNHRSLMRAWFTTLFEAAGLNLLYMVQPADLAHLAGRCPGISSGLPIRCSLYLPVVEWTGAGFWYPCSFPFCSLQYLYFWKDSVLTPYPVCHFGKN